jgi:dihydrofolate reductase
LIYSCIASLDGYTEDASGQFEWAAPDPEVHAFLNDSERPIGTYLYGRMMYQTMAVWETDPALAAGSAESADYATIWQAADKIIFSGTLAEVSTRRTRIERNFDATLVRRLKADARQDLSIGGPTLAGEAIRRGLVDEYHCFLVPELVGSGKPAIQEDARLSLELLDQRSFSNGTVYLRYRLT